MVFDVLPLTWQLYLGDIIHSENIKTLDSLLSNAYENEVIYPTQDSIFTAFELTSPNEVKVVILGQDPYHDEGQAHGLAFSVNKGIKFPPSLRNIFKELCDDVGCDMPSHGNLSSWAKEGVLLMNSVLSVSAHKAHSHKEKGWEFFTDSVVSLLSKTHDNLIFILWGKPAQNKMKLIDDSKHFVITAPHPSPLSSYRGFFGSKPFSKTNSYLKSIGKEPIQWCLETI